MANVETVTISIADDDGNTDELEIPAGLLEMLREADETDTDVVGDIVVLSMASRVHHVAQHGDGEPSAEIQAVEEATMDLFEDRFGLTFGEATGHQH